MCPVRLSHCHTAYTVCTHRYCPWPKKPTFGHSPAPQLLGWGFSLCPSPFLARWPPLGSTSSGCFWESQPVIRALISRTSCQPLPEVGAGRGGKQGQSKVKFKAWGDQERLLQGDGLTDSSSPEPLQAFVLQVRTLRPREKRDSSRVWGHSRSTALLSPGPQGPQGGHPLLYIPQSSLPHPSTKPSAEPTD